MLAGLVKKFQAHYDKNHSPRTTFFIIDVMQMGLACQLGIWTHWGETFDRLAAIHRHTTKRRKINGQVSARCQAT